MAVSDWKTKYLDIRAKLLEATDTAYRLGFADGVKEGQMQQMQQQAQMQAQAEAQAAAQMDGAPGAPGEEGMPPGEEVAPEEGSMPGMEEEGMPGAVEGAPAPGMEEGGSELDQHISELEGLVAKGEKPSVLTMRKAVQALSDMRKSQKSKWAKKVEVEASSQKKFVDGILKKWEKEAKSDVNEGLEDIIKEHGIKIEE